MPVPNNTVFKIQPAPITLDLDFLFQTMNSKPIDASVDEKMDIVSLSFIGMVFTSIPEILSIIFIAMYVLGASI